jgi:threonine dehydrogenase-like Zn-dependent dehydrogenase
MKAIAIKPADKTVGVIDHAEPSLTRPTDVKVRILDVGVCGTDREICAFEYGTPPAGNAQLVIGHESLGEVIEVGSAVRDLHAGDLVVPTVRRPCGHAVCAPCGHARQDFCITGEFTERGINGAHGFMAELVVEDARFVSRVPAALRDVAVLVEPLTIAEKAMAQLRAIDSRMPWLDAARRRALVLGAGPVGLLAAMKFAADGFDTFVYARNRGPNLRTAVVDRIGATYLSGESMSLADVARHIGNIDLVFEATGSSRAAFDVLPFLGVNGTFVLSGVPAQKGAIPVDADTVMRNMVLKNQVLVGTVNAGKQDFESAIADLERFERRWPGAVRALITGRHKPEAARDLLVSSPKGIKDVIAFAA